MKLIGELLITITITILTLFDVSTFIDLDSVKSETIDIVFTVNSELEICYIDEDSQFHKDNDGFITFIDGNSELCFIGSDDNIFKIDTGKQICHL